MLETYPLLGELAGTLVLGVAKKFDNTALVRGETAVEKRSVSGAVLGWS